MTPREVAVRGERILIIGMARSGFGAARLCVREGARVTCLDLKQPMNESVPVGELESAGVRFIWGPHPLEILEATDRIVKSPGVRGEIPFLETARRRGIPIWSELELASRFAQGPILGITGTNGKSTSTAWAGDMLARCGRAHETVGNIGRPISEGVLEGVAGGVLVTEISSFQLEDIEAFHPSAAAILNLTPDHLDRHGDLASYREAKMRIFKNQTPDDIAIVGEQNDIADEIRARYRPQLLRFRLQDAGEEGTFRREERLGRRFRGRETILCRSDQLSLPGPHNVANALAALALVAPLDLPDEGLVESLRRFPGLPHRLERCGTIRGILYVNDSKATNTDSLSTALDAWGGSSLILLAGGRDKGQDFRPLAHKVRLRCRSVCLFGESKDLIRSQWGEDICETFDTMADAIDHASAIAEPGEIVLLSPACASFDQFKDYEERGDSFRELVRSLAERDGGARR